MIHSSTRASMGAARSVVGAPPSTAAAMAAFAHRPARAFSTGGLLPPLARHPGRLITCVPRSGRLSPRGYAVAAAAAAEEGGGGGGKKGKKKDDGACLD